MLAYDLGQKHHHEQVYVLCRMLRLHNVAWDANKRSYGDMHACKKSVQLCIHKDTYTYVGGHCADLDHFLPYPDIGSW